jgi:hypothetical protein
LSSAVVATSSQATITSCSISSYRSIEYSTDSGADWPAFSAASALMRASS